jgi:hypothetical protein
MEIIYKRNYLLVNPYINGSITRVYSGASPLDAAYLAFQTVSSTFSNSVPRFYFTMRDINTGYFNHFRVDEIRSSEQLGNRIDYTITYLQDYEIPMQLRQGFLQKIVSLNSKYMNSTPRIRNPGTESWLTSANNTSSTMTDTDTTDTDSYMWFVQNPIKPISYYWYTPVIYYQNIHDMKTFHTPSFVNNMAPYVEIDLELISNYFPTTNA